MMMEKKRKEKNDEENEVVGRMKKINWVEGEKGGGSIGRRRKEVGREGKSAGLFNSKRQKGVRTRSALARRSLKFRFH